MASTDKLIETLSGQAGGSGTTTLVWRGILVAAGAALATALAMVWMMTGFRDDMHSLPFMFKTVGALALVAGGLVLARRAALPAGGPLNLLWLVPGLLFYVVFAGMDPEVGDEPALACAADIIMLSLPALGLLMLALRNAAPTRPALAGATAGLLAGALGTAAHAMTCENDQGLSVLLWYGAAIAVTSGLGALIGRKALRW